MSRLLACLTLTLACCGPAPGRTGYLMFDAEALQAGASVQIGHWQGAPVLPVSLDVGDNVHVMGPEGGRLIQVTAGSLAYVRGSSVEATWLRLGSDVRDDALTLDASEESARELAKRLDAQLAPAMKGFLLTGHELIDHISFMKAPPGIREALPEGVSVGPAASALEVAAAPPGASAGAATQLVGFYIQDGRVLSLDAEGGFQLLTSCGMAPVNGRFRQEGAQLVLTPSEGAAMAWAMDSRGLTDPSGARFEIPGDEP